MRPFKAGENTFSAQIARGPERGDVDLSLRSLIARPGYEPRVLTLRSRSFLYPPPFTHKCTPLSEQRNPWAAI